MRSIFIVLLFTSLAAFSQTFPTPLPVLPLNEETIKEDLNKILSEGKFSARFDVKFSVADKSRVSLQCKGNGFEINVHSPVSEMTSAFYKAVRELGFYFPHPLRQISPSLSDIKKKCGKSWNWRPALRYRGFHLHTLHPNEWVKAFYQNRPDIAEKTIRWLARNHQNTFDLSLLDVPLSEIKRQMRPAFELARKFQIHTGVSLGIALNQQNSYKLLSLWDSYFGWNSDELIEKGINELTDALPLSFMTLEAGSSEFTPTDFDKSIRWLNLCGEIFKKKGMVHLTKVHVSSNQHSKRWGNYNMLPQYTNSHVGILPHTVMFYGIVDEIAPMYGNKNFLNIRDFMLQEKSKRPTWYYPETSYWVGMDVDVPLFLTDFLRTRALDTKFLHENGVEGQFNFSSGHVLGYWLFDWNLTLITDLDYNFDPMIGLKLIGEDPKVWEKIIEYQKVWYKEKQLIPLLSSANLQDELSETHRIHDRFTMKQLSNNPEQVKKEVALLKESFKAFPDYNGVKNEEIKTLLIVNQMRHAHALSIREALIGNKDRNLETARSIREEAKVLIQSLEPLPTNYPDLELFKKWNNPTAYQFGYVYPAASLYFWEREERQIREDSYFPFWGNMYDVIDIVL